MAYFLQISDFKFSLRFSFLVFFRDIIPLIVQFLTFRKSNFHFYKTSVEVHLEGNHCISLFLHLAENLVNFLFMEQKLSRSQRIFIKDISLS